jgi:acyl-CoA reductase-like NAD-dependent aldehyde dehydrogenase
MQEEIFGPILPISEASSVEDVIDFINAQPSPLGLYLFSENPRLSEIRGQLVRPFTITASQSTRLFLTGSFTSTR